MKRHLIILAMVLVIGGCAQGRQAMLDVSNEAVANSKAFETVGSNIISTWLVTSGALRGYFGNDLNDASKKEVKAILGKLDKLAAVKVDARTAKQKGEAIGNSVSLARLLGEQIFEKMLPDIWALIRPYLPGL